MSEEGMSENREISDCFCFLCGFTYKKGDIEYCVTPLLCCLEEKRNTSVCFPTCCLGCGPNDNWIFGPICANFGNNGCCFLGTGLYKDHFCCPLLCVYSKGKEITISPCVCVYNNKEYVCFSFGCRKKIVYLHGITGNKEIDDYIFEKRYRTQLVKEFSVCFCNIQSTGPIYQSMSDENIRIEFGSLHSMEGR